MSPLRRTSALVFVSGMLLAGPLPAQTHASAVQRPGGETTTLPLPYPRAAKFTTDEGTWLSLDVSPDGRTIVFDLVGDLYTLPISGGTATRITDGPGYDAQPRFSPDGKHVVFVSDRSGSENLYTVAPDGRDLRALTTGEGKSYRSPAWTRDGQFIIAVSRGPYDLYLYPTDGGAATKLNADPPEDPPGPGAAPGGGIVGHEFLGPAFGSDGRYLYYSTKRRVLRPGSLGNLTEFVWKIGRYDFETGEQTDIALAPGGAMRPLLSPDRKWLVYATRRDAGTSLRVLELETREGTWLIHGVQRDDQESRYTRDVMPGSAFTPDSRAIVTAYNGKIWRVEVPSGKATMIPFAADVELQLGELVHFEYPINDSTLSVTQIRDPRLSPDNRRVVFTALDKVYVMDLPNGRPRRLTNSEVGEYHPVWSPDGKWIAYVTWDDSSGAVYRVRADGRSRPERLTRQGGYYRRVNYNPSGSRLLVWRADRPSWFGRISEDEPSLVWLRAAGGDVTVITPVGGDPNRPTSFPYFVNRDSTRIYLGTESVRWDGSDRKRQLRGGMGATFSADGKRFFIEQGNRRTELVLRRTPFARDVPFELTPAGAPLLGRQVSGIAAEFPAWSPDGSKLIWAAGSFLFIYDIAQGDAAVADSLRRAQTSSERGRTANNSATRSRPGYEAERMEVTITVPKDRPSGVLVLRNARIITMRGDEVIERGDLVVTNNRITGVGPTGTVRIPGGAKVIDLQGKTIVPGLVDIHAHPDLPRFSELHARQPWEHAAAMAYGVTTTRDPQTETTDVLTYQDLVETGEALGSRIFSTGPGIGGGEFATLDGARHVLRRYSDYYRTNTVKQYGAGDRQGRQHFLMAARELKLTPTLEGGRDFKKNITEAIDGYAGSEHAYPIAPLYRDMVEIVARSGITYTPVLLGNYGGPSSQSYMYAKYQGMHDDPKLRRFVPHSEIDRRFLRREHWFADSQYTHELVAAQATKIVRAGGRVGLGGHGYLPGLGEHWELWLLQSGGMSNLEALRCATLFGAEAIGLGSDLGSLEPGKLADLIVLDANPLEDIHNTLSIRSVMKNGRHYDGNTLDEVWPRPRSFGRKWWQEDEVH
jgi:Tol biopolymer transport system component